MDRILLNLPERLEGERIVLRPWRAGDGAALFEAVDSSREAILPWLPWGRSSHATPEVSETLVRQWRSKWDLREDLSMGIWVGERLVGGLGLHHIDWNLPAFEIGYWLRQDAWGNGYVTEAGKLALGLAFGRLGAVRVALRCATGNERSAAVAHRLGMKEEGLLRNATKDADGHLWDVRVFAQVAEEGER